MTRHIEPGKRLIQEFHPGQPQLPIDKLIVQYIRQSTLVQVKNNKQSAILQDIKLTRRLMAYGWPDERIIKIDTDQGKSGQKRRDERVGLDELYRLVLSGKAGAVAAYDASRLSPVTLEDQENTAKPKLDRRYDATCDALLENLSLIHI